MAAVNEVHNGEGMAVLSFGRTVRSPAVGPGICAVGRDWPLEQWKPERKGHGLLALVLR